MTLSQAVKRLFRKLTPAEVCASELAEAELSKLTAQSEQEYAAAMVSYQEARIKRLRGFLKTTGEQA